MGRVVVSAIQLLADGEMLLSHVFVLACHFFLKPSGHWEFLKNRSVHLKILTNHPSNGIATLEQLLCPGMLYIDIPSQWCDPIDIVRPNRTRGRLPQANGPTTTEICHCIYIKKRWRVTADRSNDHFQRRFENGFEWGRGNEMGGGSGSGSEVGIWFALKFPLTTILQPLTWQYKPTDHCFKNGPFCRKKLKAIYLC